MSEFPKPALPARPHLNWLKNRAKEKLAALRPANPSARLAEAQLAIAREYGFASWRNLKAYVDANHDQGEAIVQAVRSGDLASINRIVDRHPELVNATTDREQRVLPSDARAMRLIHVAVAENQVAAAKLLLDRGADSNLRNADGRLPIHDCYELGRIEIERELEKHGAEIDVCIAAANGRLDVLRSILETDPALANDMSTNMSPLAWVGFSPNPQSAEILFEYGAIIDRPPYDYEALHATAMVANVPVLRVLLKHGADPDWRDKRGNTLMHIAVRSRLVADPLEYVGMLLDAGCDPAARNDAGRTPLDEAIAMHEKQVEDHGSRKVVGKKQYAKVIEMLRSRMSAGRIAPGRAAIEEAFSAARRGDKASLFTLLGHSPGLINAHDAKGNTLIRVVMSERPQNANEIVATLLELDIELDIFSAAQLGRVERVEQLLALDSSLAKAIDGGCGFTALCWAGRYWGGVDAAPHARCAERLIAAGADLAFRDAELDWTPLHHTAEWWVRTDVAETLLRHGAAINARTRDGKTPLDYAVQNDRRPMIRFLREHRGKIGAELDGEGTSPAAS